MFNWDFNYPRHTPQPQIFIQIVICGKGELAHHTVNVRVDAGRRIRNEFRFFINSPEISFYAEMEIFVFWEHSFDIATGKGGAGSFQLFIAITGWMRMLYKE